MQWIGLLFEPNTLADIVIDFWCWKPLWSEALTQDGLIPRYRTTTPTDGDDEGISVQRHAGFSSRRAASTRAAVSFPYLVMWAAIAAAAAQTPPRAGS
jgi:hypothetical protein